MSAFTALDLAWFCQEIAKAIELDLPDGVSFSLVFTDGELTASASNTEEEAHVLAVLEHARTRLGLGPEPSPTSDPT